MLIKMMVAAASILIVDPADAVKVEAPEPGSARWSVEADEATLGALIDALSDAGVSVQGAPLDRNRAVSGIYSGELSAVLARALRDEDYVLSFREGGYVVHFLSGAQGRPGVRQNAQAVAAAQARPSAVSRASHALPVDLDGQVGNPAVVSDIMAVQFAQFAPGAEQASRDGSSSNRTATPAEIAELNRQAASQLAGLVAALQQVCPEGASCD